MNRQMVYTWKKTVDYRKALVEKLNIVALRLFFTNERRNYRRKGRKPCFYRSTLDRYTLHCQEVMTRTRE